MPKVVFPARLKTVLSESVIDAIFNHPHTAGWQEVVASKIQSDQTFAAETKDYHRTTICGQGQADFRVGNNNLTADDIALLYCFYFFQMHFTSSVAVYHKYREDIVAVIQNSSKITFVDIGCGPYTSGIAFLYFMQLAGVKEKLADRLGKVALSYLGVDNAESMTKLGANLLAAYQATLTDDEWRYNSMTDCSDFQDLKAVAGCGSETTIIINCCYFFASDSLNVAQFTATIQQVIDGNKGAKILLFYQNAPTNVARVSAKYSVFKQAIKGLTAGGTNIEELSFSYDDEFKAAKWVTLNFRVRQQLLKNY